MSDNSGFGALFTDMERFLAADDSPTLVGDNFDQQQSQVQTISVLDIVSRLRPMGCEFGLNTYNLCSHHVTVNAISLFQWPPNVGFAVVNSPHSSFIRETPSKGVIPLSAASSAVLNNPQEDSLRPCAHNPGAALCIPTTCSQLVQRASDGMKISPQYSGLSIPARHVLLVSEVEWERILVNDPRKIPSASLIAKHSSPTPRSLPHAHNGYVTVAVIKLLVPLISPDGLAVHHVQANSLIWKMRPPPVQSLVKLYDLCQRLLGLIALSLRVVLTSTESA
ncbi:unnamed protein product [Toxocara canis]|uniref:Uncharacterized protein n=1 Tax=Toxocara canis TaxID=6265 RepID=A0A183V9Z5_TOXCA|nr:unnamed protein product [Toxocara canis]